MQHAAFVTGCRSDSEFRGRQGAGANGKGEKLM